MQIVRDLGGYTLGRSDIVRRAMSKKKADVMERERHNFVYGSEDEGVPGCLKKGIPEPVANKIYDDMMSFASYAFNKSHAAAYAVVAYQTAYLKYYHPVEFMAALMTSVIDNSAKVSQYIYSCKSMGISILPPDINRGVAGFSVEGNSILYGLCSIKGVGWPVIEAVVKERNNNGKFCDLNDFLKRLGESVNKRVVENCIKAGAFDCFNGTRKQHMNVYGLLMDSIAKERKQNMTGQLSLFDIAGDEAKSELAVKLPDIGEFSKEEMLAYEKEVLGIYVSGHPLDEYISLWKRNITNKTSDFLYDEGEGECIVKDGQRAVIGGLIESKTIKYTKNNKVMAFLKVEDLLGTVEVIVWPNDYEKNAGYLNEESKVFIEGRVNAEEEKDAKLICDKIIPFDRVPKKLWIKFATKEAYENDSEDLIKLIAQSDGKDIIVIYIEATKEIKTLSKNQSVSANEELVGKLMQRFGSENVKLN